MKRTSLLFGTWGLITLGGFIVQWYVLRGGIWTPKQVDWMWAVLSTIGIIVSLLTLPWGWRNTRFILITWIAITLLGGAYTSLLVGTLHSFGNLGHYLATINVIWPLLIGIAFALTAWFDDSFIFNYFALLAVIDLLIFAMSQSIFNQYAALLIGLTLGLPLTLLALRGDNYKLWQPDGTGQDYWR